MQGLHRSVIRRLLTWRCLILPTRQQCLSDHCNGKRLAAYTESTNVTVFTLSGPRPASKITLKCCKCNTNYGYSKFGNKSSGERYYEEERPFVEASDVVFLDRDIYQLFASLRSASVYVAYVALILLYMLKKYVPLSHNINH